MFPGMDMFAAEPAQLDDETREHLAKLLDQRAELLVAQAELGRLRARQHRGEDVGDVVDLKVQEVSKLRHELTEEQVGLFRSSVDFNQLVGLLPLLLGGVMQSFKVPPATLAEIWGLDIDMVKRVFGKLKEFAANGIELNLGSDE